MSDGFVILVEFDVPPPHRAEFTRLVLANAAASVRDEPGCRRFDVLQPEDDAAPIVLYEIYADRDAFKAHLATPHFKAFDAATMPIVSHRKLRRFDLHENAT